MTAPLRVVFLDHCALWSGGEIALLRTLQSLPEVDRSVWLAEDGPLVGPLRDAGVRVEVLPLDGGARSVSRDSLSSLPWRSVVSLVRYTATLSARLRRERPDLVHTNSLKAAVYGGIAARLAGVPVVWHARDRISSDYLPAPTAVAVRALCRWLPDVVVANSRATLTSLRLPSRKRTAVIADPYRPTRRPTRTTGARNLRFAMVGRLAPWKGQDVFLEAFALALRGTGHRAVIAGSAMFGEDEYASALQATAVELGIADQVEFSGFVGDVEQLLGEADVLVHASRVPEPFGQVVVEGLAAGLPVVASDAGGPAEIIVDGVDGLLTPPGDAHQLAARLKLLAQDDDLRDRLAAQALVTARRYLPEAVKDDFLTVFRETARRRPARRGRTHRHVPAAT